MPTVHNLDPYFQLQRMMQEKLGPSISWTHALQVLSLLLLLRQSLAPRQVTSSPHRHKSNDVAPRPWIKRPGPTATNWAPTFSPHISWDDPSWDERARPCNRVRRAREESLQQHDTASTRAPTSLRVIQAFLHAHTSSLVVSKESKFVLWLMLQKEGFGGADGGAARGWVPRGSGRGWVCGVVGRCWGIKIMLRGKVKTVCQVSCCIGAICLWLGLGAVVGRECELIILATLFVNWSGTGRGSRGSDGSAPRHFAHCLPVAPSSRASHEFQSVHGRHHVA